tara:strand:- start:13769 stop:15301 length:1533 start_codon:yes stop_codon:yes gene_type:complete
MELINSNFRYLRGPYPELYRAGKTCELLIDIDADACSSKLRYFAEVWLLYWAHAHGKVLAANGLYSMIQKSIQLGLLNNDDVVEQLHHLRNIGNVGAHISINSITGEIERTFVTKQQLKSCLNVAMNLGETLCKRFCSSNIPNEIEKTVNINQLIDAYQVLNENPISVFTHAKKCLACLHNLPRTNSRIVIDKILLQIDEAIFWANKSIRLGESRGYLLLLEIYSGEAHPKGKNDEEFRKTKKQALDLESTGDVRFSLARSYLALGKKSVALDLLLTAFDMGHIEAFENALSLSFELGDKEQFSRLIDLGIKQRNAGALAYQVSTDVLNKSITKDTKRNVVFLKATSMPGVKYLDGLLALFDDGSSIQDEVRAIEKLVKYWNKMPKYMFPASLTALFAEAKGQLELLCNKVALEAIGEAKLLNRADAGRLYFVLALYDIDCAAKNKIRHPDIYFEHLINLAVKFGCEDAKSHQEEYASFKRSLIGRKNKTNRANLKERRKQGQKARKKRK